MNVCMLMLNCPPGSFAFLCCVVLFASSSSLLFTFSSRFLHFISGVFIFLFLCFTAYSYAFVLAECVAYNIPVWNLGHGMQAHTCWTSSMCLIHSSARVYLCPMSCYLYECLVRWCTCHTHTITQDTYESVVAIFFGAVYEWVSICVCVCWVCAGVRARTTSPARPLLSFGCTILVFSTNSYFEHCGRIFVYGCVECRECAAAPNIHILYISEEKRAGAKRYRVEEFVVSAGIAKVNQCGYRHLHNSDKSNEQPAQAQQ